MKMQITTPQKAETIYQYVGKTDDFTSLEIFDLSRPALVYPDKLLPESCFTIYNERIRALDQYSIDQVLAMRLSLYTEQEELLTQTLHGLCLDERAVNLSDEMICNYLRNTLDYVIYKKSTETSKDRVNNFHHLKEHLFINEDYRDQLELFMEIRQPYVMRDDSLQENLEKEYSFIASYTEQILKLYELALSFFDKTPAVANG